MIKYQTERRFTLGPRVRSMSLLALICACFAVTPVIAAQRFWLLAANETPQAVEMEFWRSAERIGTPDAYRAYLAAFPNGMFAPLARAALGRDATATPVPRPAPVSPTAALKPADIKPSPNLRYFSETAPNTGAIEFKLGDRFVGPGPLTVGWFGAKKQVVLPPGEWVVLAASDSKSNQSHGYLGVRPVPVATISFGKFSGERLSTLLQFITNIRPGDKTFWSDIDGCERAGETRLHIAKTRPTNFRDECASIRGVASPLVDSTAATDEVLRSLDRLGVKRSGTAVATILTFAEQVNGYLGVTRLDWPAIFLGADADNPDSWTPEGVSASPARRAYVKSLLAWADSYRKVASDGYSRKLGVPDLSAGAPARSTGAVISEFDPTK